MAIRMGAVATASAFAVFLSTASPAEASLLEHDSVEPDLASWASSGVSPDPDVDEHAEDFAYGGLRANRSSSGSLLLDQGQNVAMVGGPEFAATPLGSSADMGDGFLDNCVNLGSADSPCQRLVPTALERWEELSVAPAASLNAGSMDTLALASLAGFRGHDVGWKVIPGAAAILLTLLGIVVGRRHALR